MTEVYKLKNSYKWVVLAISFLLMLTFAISLQALPPIFDQITKDIPFSNSQAGMLMGAYAIPGVLISFLIAYWVKKVSPKKMIISGLIIMIIGLIAFSLSGSFISLLMWRLVIGTGATVMVVLSPLLVTIFFDNKNMGIAMGIFNIAVPFGTVLSANLFGILGQLIEWRTIILGIAAFVGVALIVVFFALFLPKSKDTKKSDDDQIRGQQKFQMSLGLWLLGLIWALTNLQFLAYITFGPQYFQLIGISAQRAGLLASFIMLMPILISPLVGIIIDKTGRGKQLLLIGSIIIAASFVLIIKSSAMIPLWAVTLGIGTAPIPVFIFSLLPEMVEPHNIGMGLGILTVASNLGLTVGPAIFGLILDITSGSFFIGFMVLAFISLVIILALFGLKTKKDRCILPE